MPFLPDPRSLELRECMNFAKLVRLQPFYLTLAESAKAYVQVEEQRDTLLADLERLSREFSFLFLYTEVPFVIPNFVEHVCDFAESGEKKELENALAAHREESKKELDAAANSTAARKRGYADQLAALAQAMGGKYSLLLLIC